MAVPFDLLFSNNDNDTNEEPTAAQQHNTCPTCGQRIMYAPQSTFANSIVPISGFYSPIPYHGASNCSYPGLSWPTPTKQPITPPVGETPSEAWKRLQKNKNGG